MKILRLTLVLASAGALSACAYPVGTLEQGDVSTGLYFPGAPAGARAIVDGADAGEAALFDGRKTILVVEPGKHRVVVQAGATPLYDQSIYVGSGSRLAIEVR